MMFANQEAGNQAKMDPWSMSTILTAVLPHEEMLLESWLTFFFKFLPFSSTKDRQGSQFPPAVKSFLHQISVDMTADFLRLPKTISLARSVRHVLTRRCNLRS